MSSIPQAKMAAMTEDGLWELEPYAFEDVGVSAPAPGVAVVAYAVRQTVETEGERQELHAADSSTWIRGADGRPE